VVRRWSGGWVRKVRKVSLVDEEPGVVQRRDEGVIAG